jgi:hypothetical protein
MKTSQGTLQSDLWAQRAEISALTQTIKEKDLELTKFNAGSIPTFHKKTKSSIPFRLRCLIFMHATLSTSPLRSRPAILIRACVHHGACKPPIVAKNRKGGKALDPRISGLGPSWLAGPSSGQWHWFPPGAFEPLLWMSI